MAIQQQAVRISGLVSNSQIDIDKTLRHNNRMFCVFPFSWRMRADFAKSPLSKNKGVLHYCWDSRTTMKTTVAPIANKMLIVVHRC